VEDYQARAPPGTPQDSSSGAMVPSVVGMCPSRLSFGAPAKKTMPLSFDLYGRLLQDGNEAGMKRIINDMLSALVHMQQDEAKLSSQLQLWRSDNREASLEVAEQVCTMTNVLHVAAAALLVWKRGVCRWAFDQWSRLMRPEDRAATSRNVGKLGMKQFRNGARCTIMLMRHTLLIWGLAHWKTETQCQQRMKAARATEAGQMEELQILLRQLEDQKYMTAVEYKMKLQTLMRKIQVIRDENASHISSSSAPSDSIVTQSVHLDGHGEPPSPTGAHEPIYDPSELEVLNGALDPSDSPKGEKADSVMVASGTILL